MLKISNLSVSVEDKQILKDFNLNIKPGEIHAIMGPNGVGKSTLSRVLMGDDHYKIDSGEITFLDEDLTKLKVDERARKGIFIAYQHPREIEGVNNIDFLKAAVDSKSDEPLNLFKFATEVENLTKELKLKDGMLYRNINQGFSGGEKKKNEILQMRLLKPKLVILDEIDSGLDVDSLKIVALSTLDYIKENKDTSLIIITHYPRILEYIKPDYVHIIKDGKIIKTSDASLAFEIEKEGFSKFSTNDIKEKS